jgi:hypothetical protein
MARDVPRNFGLGLKPAGMGSGEGQELAPCFWPPFSLGQLRPHPNEDGYPYYRRGSLGNRCSGCCDIAVSHAARPRGKSASLWLGPLSIAVLRSVS